MNSREEEEEEEEGVLEREINHEELEQEKQDKKEHSFSTHVLKEPTSRVTINSRGYARNVSYLFLTTHSFH